MGGGGGRGEVGVVGGEVVVGWMGGDRGVVVFVD